MGQCNTIWYKVINAISSPQAVALLRSQEGVHALVLTGMANFQVVGQPEVIRFISHAAR